MRTTDNLQVKLAKMDSLLDVGPGGSDTKSEPPLSQDYKSNKRSEKNWFSCGADKCKEVTCGHTRVRTSADDNIKYVPSLSRLLLRIRACTMGCGEGVRHKNDG